MNKQLTSLLSVGVGDWVAVDISFCLAVARSSSVKAMTCVVEC